jgi:hypothetical protein
MLWQYKNPYSLLDKNDHQAIRRRNFFGIDGRMMY